MISWAPRSASTRDMSGNADSKQISTPIGSGRPARSTAWIRCAPSPGIMLLGAALLMLVSQPSAPRNGMYSPNGTSRVFTYEPTTPCGPISSATLDLPPPGSVESWLTRICAPVRAASASIRSSRPVSARSMS